MKKEDTGDQESTDPEKREEGTAERIATIEEEKRGPIRQGIEKERNRATDRKKIRRMIEATLRWSHQPKRSQRISMLRRSSK